MKVSRVVDLDRFDYTCKRSRSVITVPVFLFSCAPVLLCSCSPEVF